MGRSQRRSGKILIILFFFFLSILAILFFQSSYSKIQEYHITGTDLISYEEVVEASGTQLGEQILNVTSHKIAAELSQHPLIKSVEVKKAFPGKVIIDLEEYRIVGYLLKDGHALQPLLENGYILESRLGFDVSYPIITEWDSEESLVNFAIELSLLYPEIRQEISEIRFTPTEADPHKVILYMRDGYEVRTTTFHFAQLLNYYSYILATLEGEERPGIINLSDAGISYISYQAIEKLENDEQATE